MTQLLDSQGAACFADGLGANSIAVVVMGVAGSGKTTIGTRLAEKLHSGFFDGDDYHPAANVEKMRRGQPLTDEDRAPWLDRLRQLIVEKLCAGESAVIACSALKDAYRKRLLPADPGLASRVRLLYLSISPEDARERLLSRPGHFMPVALVDSQFEALEEPTSAIRINAGSSVDQVIEEAVAALSIPDTGRPS